MAEENKLNAKIQLRNDSLDNWNKNSTVILQKGEVGFVAIPGNNASTPTILFKVGDGKTQFAKLPWVTALAADVYAWAKAEHKPTYTASEVGVTEANFPGLNKTGTVTSVKLNGTSKTPTNGVVDLGNNILTVDSSTLTKDHLINWATVGIEDSGIDKSKVAQTDKANTFSGTQRFFDNIQVDGSILLNYSDLDTIAIYENAYGNIVFDFSKISGGTSILSPGTSKVTSNILTDNNIRDLYAEASDINALFGITSTIASENTTASENTVVRE